MLSIRDLSFHYQGVHALRHVTMEIKPGRVTCVVGRNGAGKSTLLKCIMGLRELADTEGAIVFNGQDMSRLPGHRRTRLGLGLVPQDRGIFPKLTVEQNLLVSLEGKPAKASMLGRFLLGYRSVPDEVYESFPMLQDVRYKKGGELSGGQQQQLAIARALAGNPRVLLLDEPTEGIERKTVNAIGDLLRQQANLGMTILLVEQNVRFVKDVCDEFYVLERGVASESRDIEAFTDALVEDALGL